MSIAVVRRMPGRDHNTAGVLFEPTGRTNGSPTAPRSSPGANPPILRLGRSARGVQSEPPQNMLSAAALAAQLAAHFQSEWAPPAPTAVKGPSLLSATTALDILNKPAPVAIGQGPSSAFSKRLTPIAGSPAGSKNPTPSVSPATLTEKAQWLPRYESGDSAVSEGDLPHFTSSPVSVGVIKPYVPVTETEVVKDLYEKYPHLAIMDRSSGERIDLEGRDRGGVFAESKEQFPPTTVDETTQKVREIAAGLCARHPRLALLDQPQGPRVDSSFNWKRLSEGSLSHPARH